MRRTGGCKWSRSLCVFLRSLKDAAAQLFASWGSHDAAPDAATESNEHHPRPDAPPHPSGWFGAFLLGGTRSVGLEGCAGAPRSAEEHSPPEPSARPRPASGAANPRSRCTVVNNAGLLLQQQRVFRDSALLCDSKDLLSGPRARPEGAFCAPRGAPLDTLAGPRHLARPRASCST